MKVCSVIFVNECQWILSMNVNEYLLCTHCMPGTRLGTCHPGTFKEVSPFKEILNSYREFVHYSEDLWLQGNESGCSLGSWREKFHFFCMSWLGLLMVAGEEGILGVGRTAVKSCPFCVFLPIAGGQVELNRRRGLTPLERFWIALCDDTQKCAYLLSGTASKVEFLPLL